MTCAHISEAKNKLIALKGRIGNTNNSLYKQKAGGPWVKKKDIGVNLDVGWFSAEASPDIKASHTIWNIDENELTSCLNEIENKLSECSCYASESARKSDLANAHREETKRMEERIKGTEKRYAKIVDKQHALIETERKQNREENALVRKENSQLQRALGLSEGQAKQLEVQLSEKKTELSQKNQALERLKQAFQDLLVSEATYRTEARVVKEQLDWTKVRLENSDAKVAEKERRLEQKQQQYEGIQESLTNLRIKYRTETKDKDNELRNKEKEIKLLKSQAETSQKELLEERLELKEEKMEEFADELGIDLKQVNKLRGYYESLLNARKDLNQNDISTNEYIITEFKQEILNKGIGIKKVQKLCKKCEKAAEIRLELGFKPSSIPQQQEKTSPNYSFGRERNWKNINPNFTPELVQEWKNYGFTYEECVDWVNINSPERQNQAIKEPSYYAWLRDIKQVDSYWVLNEGDSQQLDQEFLQWYQQQNQYQARQEVPLRNNF